MSGLFMSVVKMAWLPQCKRNNAFIAATKGNMLSVQFIYKKEKFGCSTVKRLSVACFKARVDWIVVVRYPCLFRLLLVNEVSFYLVSFWEKKT